MKHLLLFSIVLIYSCKEAPRKKEVTTEELAAYQRYKDSQQVALQESAINKKHFDSSRNETSPVKILTYKVVDSDGGNYRNVFLRYKNTSKKSITAIRFRWEGVNAFGEPADLGNPYVRGHGGGFTDDVIRPGKTDESTWSILSRDAKKLTKAWPIEVVFSDETKWKAPEE